MSLSHSPKIVTDGLVLCLDAANPRSYPKSGTTWSDLAGSNDATLINIVPSTDFSQDNRGIFTFDGSNQYATFNRPSQIVDGGSVSLVLWAKWTTTGTTTSTIQSLVDNFHSTSRITLQDRPDLSKKLTFFIGRNSTGIQSSGQVGDGTWKHISCTNDGSTSRIYINGELDNSLAGETGIGGVYDYMNIGRWGSGSRYLNGQVSGLLIYDRALTADEVLQNYNATKRRFK